MFGRLRSRLLLTQRRQASQQVEESFTQFRRCLGIVEEAKASLAAAAPAGRAQGVPLADALVGFEAALREAHQAMPDWRTAEVEEAWQRCATGMDEASGRAEALRLGEAPSGYEQLYTVLADLMEPLEAFAVALDRFRRLGA